MSALMYKKDRDPILVTDDKKSRNIMLKQGWSNNPIEVKKTKKAK